MPRGQHRILGGVGCVGAWYTHGTMPAATCRPRLQHHRRSGAGLLGCAGALHCGGGSARVACGRGGAAACRLAVVCTKAGAAIPSLCMELGAAAALFIPRNTSTVSCQGLAPKTSRQPADPFERHAQLGGGGPPGRKQAGCPRDGRVHGRGQRYIGAGKTHTDGNSGPAGHRVIRQSGGGASREGAREGR